MGSTIPAVKNIIEFDEFKKIQYSMNSGSTENETKENGSGPRDKKVWRPRLYINRQFK